MKIDINNVGYNVEPDDFPLVPHIEYCNLKIHPEVGKLERIIGLLCDTVEEVTMDNSIIIIGWRKGGFIPYNCKKRIKNVFVIPGLNQSLDDIPSEFHFKEEIRFPELVYIESGEESYKELSEKRNQSIIICNSTININSDYSYSLTNSSTMVHINKLCHRSFINAFRYYILGEGVLDYDNLIHMVIMVKNAGTGFEQILRNNLPIIDRWTILDTGSTDDTIDIINRVLVGKKKGTLYQEPFINFRESRNRLLELCGKSCKYILILDDTYWINGNLRGFLNTVRGDQYANSYSAIIKSGDSEYYSNRIIKSEEELRYIFKIHEVIQFKNNKNVVIPDNVCKIVDEESDYMRGRTKERKLLDIKLLNEMLEEDPDNPRHLYYLAQTYKCLEDWDKTAEYYKKRIDFHKEGFIQEKVDACFELARLYNFTLGRPWEECKAIYQRAFDMEPARPDPLYFIGIHYLTEENDKRTAFEYFKRAIMIGYPIHTQYSLKPTLYYHFLPKFLVPLCYDFKEYELGEKTCDVFLGSSINDRGSSEWQQICDWKVLFNQINQYIGATLAAKNHKMNYGVKQKLIFIADGGWANWSGRDILTKGVGGSETYIIEMARYIQALGVFDVYVFCKCDGDDVFEGVQYKSLAGLYNFISTEYIAHCIISRYTEYVTPCLLCPNIESVYIVLHDIGPTINIIPTDEKIRAIFCLTNWHKEFFLKAFPQFVGRTHTFGYGIDMRGFINGAASGLKDNGLEDLKDSRVSGYNFIYSSFPNRGLLPLLQMWPRIIDAIPEATLDIYCNLENEWVNRVAGDQITEIRRLLSTLENSNVTLHGWVNKAELMAAWSKADFWLYPCTFKETYCLTAMEAAASKTLAITNDLAALNETVGNRGIIIPGDPMTVEWQTRAVSSLLEIIADRANREKLVEVNYNWAATNTWRFRAELFANTYLKSEKKYITVGFRNWLDDTPVGSKIIFEEMLSMVTRGKEGCKVLEIGSYIGTSLIGILDRTGENCMATAIDRWQDYDEFDNEEMTKRDIEQVFDVNIAISGYTNRVTKLKGDSVDCLIDLIRKSEKYDFIYVDGSHKCIDCYTNMALSWSLLKPGGILAVNDYIFNTELLGTEPFSIPFLGVEHFLTKYEGKYTILNKGYRIFLQKL
jgi:tetratricopeptide (TPR) repeat protein